MTMNLNAHHEIQRQLKVLWGATAMPFAKTVRTPFSWPSFKTASQRLNQLVEVGGSGLLLGPTGVGKSVLAAQVAEALSPKRFALIKLHHTSLTGSDLLRCLCHALGQKPPFRRSDTSVLIGQLFEQLEGRFPLLLIDEAQNLSGSALEELRLLSCAELDSRSLFSLLLIGDDNLLARLQMGVNYSLLSRLGFCIALQPMEAAHSEAYLQARLREVAIEREIFDPAASLLLHQASGGIPRTINHLAQLALQNAAEHNVAQITAQHVQQALDQLPWISRVNNPN